MLKTLGKNFQQLRKAISLKRLPALVIESKRNYRTNIFIRTWWNIVIFHTFFVFVMVVVFAVILHYTKLNIFQTLSEMLDAIAAGGVVDSSLITQASRQIDTINWVILAGMVILSVVTGIAAAHITLVPTREEFVQRRKFITAVAHELRTPLAVLRTSNEVALYDVPKNSSMRPVLEENIEQAKMIASILNNLVVFSRVETPESLQFEDVDASIPLRSAIAKLTPFANKNEADIEYTPESLPMIRGNQTALEQAFYNIIKNAVIYKQPGKNNVSIRTTAEDDRVVIKIIDNGIGIPPDELKHVFEPFYRVNPDDSLSSTGTGLGLALVLEIVKLHKGIISVESTQAVGTIFTLTFPQQKYTHDESQVKDEVNKVTHSFTS